MTVKVIAEIGTANHSQDYALEATAAAANAGAWAVKIQMLQAHTLVAPHAPRYDRLPGPSNQWEQFADAIPYDDWKPVFDLGKELGVEVFASCWDAEAVDWCNHYGVNWHKVGSADITHHQLLRRIGESGADILFSTGAANAAEVSDVLDFVHFPAKAIPMACTLSYPCAPEDARLERIHWLRSLGFTTVGYSDHTPNVGTGALAVAAGAEYLEKHVTLIGEGGGGDHDFALTPTLFAEYVRQAETAWTMTHSAWPCSEPHPSELDARNRARRSLHSTERIDKGEDMILGVNVGWLRPAEGGIQANLWAGDDVVGVADRVYDVGEQIKSVF
jgi:sialic acid synthase SpsE